MLVEVQSGAALCAAGVVGVRRGPLAALAAGSLGANLGLVGSPLATELCWEVVLPLSLALSIVSLPNKGSARSLKRTGVAFAAGSLGSLFGATGTFLACRREAGLAAPLASLFASYVGGSANFFAVAKATRASMTSALAAADILAMALYFACLQLLAGGAKAPPTAEIRKKPLAALAAASAAVVVAKLVSRGRAGLETAILAAAAYAARRAEARAPGLADLCLNVFYAAVGSRADLDVVAKAPVALGLALSTLSLHAIFLTATRVVAPSLFSKEEALVASNACIGGPSTAAAFALAIGRQDLLIPAVVWGTWGYAIATAGGIHLNTLFQSWAAPAPF
ncbi:hypothetical protein CTAYLR_000543 [Chrysophaeum taylorii]|uniref:Uncharacterized protein n=1 Tax=Chrysophaeum taylorii TaxID=2483200 RepID=A0AAD7XQZ3_9STRA|nr:hypothetical protein CTAYLR_000543 [Chrysophaeum taylorii]